MWEVFIEVIDEDTDMVLVRAIRTPVALEPPYSYLCRGKISTLEQRSSILQSIKDKYTETLSDQARKLSFLAGLAQTATNALNDWENA